MDDVNKQSDKRKLLELQSTLKMIAGRLYKGAKEYVALYEPDINRWKVGWKEENSSELKFYFKYEPDKVDRIQLFGWVGDKLHGEESLKTIKKYLNIK